MTTRIEVAQLAVPITAEAEEFVKELGGTIQETHAWASKITATVESTTGAFGGMEQATGGASFAMGALGGIAAGVATGGLSMIFDVVTSIGTAMVDAFMAGPRLATEFAGAMADMQAKTGAGADEMGRFRDMVEDVYETGMGETFGAAAEAMTTVEQVTGATGEALQGLTTDALTLADVFDKDVVESVRAVDQMMTTTGVSGADMYDMITVAIQRTGDPADDLLDTLNEYASTFGEANFTAEQFFAVITAGVEAGIHNFDKAADIVREFFIRLQDGSETTERALNELFGTPGDAASVLTGKIDSLNEEIKRQEAALDEAKAAMDEADGAWGEAQETVSELESALSEARAELNELARPNLEGMEEFDDKIFGMEQNIKRTRLAMLDMEEDTPEFEAAKADLEKYNDELDRLQLERDLTYAEQIRNIEKATESGTGEAMTYNEVMAEIASKQTEIAGLESALWDAEAAEAAAGAEAERMRAVYTDLESSLAVNESQLAALRDEYENLSTPAQEFLDQLASGGIEGPEAMSKIMQGLAAIEDPLERNRIGAALFGSGWEDVGDKAVLAMDPATASLGEFAGATDAARAASQQGLGPALERLGRIVQTVLADGFEPILAAIVENVVPAFESFAEWLDGTGRETLETYGGAISEYLGEALENLGPFITDTVIPALETFANWLVEEGIPAIDDFVTWFKDELIPWVTKTAEWVRTDLIPALSQLAAFFGDVGKVIGKAVGFFATVGEAVGSVAAIFIDAKGTIETAMTAIGKVVEAIVKTISSKFDEVSNTTESVWNSIEKFLSDTWSKIETTVETVLGSIFSTVERIWNDILSTIDSILSSIFGVVERVWNDVLSTIDSILSSIFSVVERVWSDILSTIESVLSDISSFISTQLAAWADLVGETLSGISETVGDVFAGIAQTIGDELGAAYSTLAGAFNDMLAVVGDVLSGAGGIQELVSGAWEAVKQTFEDILGTDAGTGLRNLVSTAFTGIETAITSVFGEGGVGSVISTAWENIKTTVSDSIKTVVEYINGLIKAYNALPAAPDLPFVEWPPGSGQFPGALRGANFIVPSWLTEGMPLWVHPGELVRVTPREDVGRMQIPTPAALAGLGAGGVETVVTHNYELGGIVVNTPLDLNELDFRIENTFRRLMAEGEA